MPGATGGRRLRRLALALGISALACASSPARSDDAPIVRWYALLAHADGPGLASLLADDARIRLTDIGVEQTEAEFIESMSEWARAVAGSTIRYRIEERAGPAVTVIACYDFPSNDILVRETFTIRKDRIADTTQSMVAEDCTDY